MTDDSIFCPKCGEKIVVAKKNEVICADSSNKKVKRNHEVDVKNLNNLGVKNTEFADRIESSEDINVNDHLFTLYKKLIQPVKKIEAQTAKIEECEDEITMRKMLAFVWPSIKFSVLLAIIMSFVLLVIRLGLETDEQIAEFDNNSTLQQEYHNSFNLFYADKYSPVIIKPSYYVLSIYDFLHPKKEMDGFGVFLSFLLFFFAEGFIYVYPILLLIHAVIYMVKRKANNIAIHKLQSQISDATSYRKEIILKIKDYICYVPPAYRTSDALSYFVNSYENTRVGSLKEAVNAYDVYLNNNEMKMLVHQACSELRTIQTLQLQTNEQLQNINASVWGANFLF
jgi:hypothetical protein